MNAATTITEAYESESVSRRFHTTRLDTETGELHCSCPGFTYRHTCWHIDAIADRNVSESTGWGTMLASFTREQREALDCNMHLLQGIACELSTTGEYLRLGPVARS